MRHIATSTSTVESLKKQAKKLQRTGGGKHTDLLDRVARGAGYLHWHHALICAEKTGKKTGVEALRSEVEIILRAAKSGTCKAILTGPELILPPMLLFAAESDAWLLDPGEALATCLAWRGNTLESQFDETETQIKIGWDGTYKFAERAFHVSTGHPVIGSRAIFGYPVEELQKVAERATALRLAADEFRRKHPRPAGLDSI